MNALEDTRELVTTTSAPDKIADFPIPYAAAVAGFVDDLIHLYPDVELSSIRITELDGIITVTGRRGPLTDECPSCHTTAGHPHTDYCRTTQIPELEALCGFRSLDNTDLACTYPPHHLNQPHRWQDGGDPRGWRNAIDPNKP